MNFVGKNYYTFVLISFLSVAFFSLMMVHGADGYMSATVLYLAAGLLVSNKYTRYCGTSYIYLRSFFNTPIGLGLRPLFLLLDFHIPLSL